MTQTTDMREGTGIGVLGPPLFVATLLFYLVTLTPFIDLSVVSASDPAVNRSNSLNQLVFMGLTASLWLTVLTAPERRLAVRPRGLLIATLLWFAAVSIFSAHPDLALKRVVLATLTILNAGVFLLLPRSERQFAGMLSICCLITLALAYLGVALLPHLAIHQASEIREPMNAGFWRGHFAHKNVAAATMVIISFAGLYLYGTGRRFVGGAITLLAVVFLTQTGGKSSSAALPGILAAAWAFERWRAIRIPMVFLGIAAFNAVTIGCSVSPAMRSLVASLGVDPTFTNRIDIWRVGASAVADKPLTGYGFQLFWQTDELVYSKGGTENWALAAFNGHNAYLDAAVTTGIPGLLLTLALLVWLPLRDVGRAEVRDNDPTLTRFFIRIWLYGVFAGCVESLYFQSGSLVWFMLIVSIFGLRLQASAREVWAPQVEPRDAEPAHA
jgi:O-antigen ligase